MFVKKMIFKLVNFKMIQKVYWDKTKQKNI